MEIPATIPTTPFERYMLADDQLDYPMVASMELEFGGRLNSSLLVDALATALLRHPLLTARIRGSGLASEWDTSTAARAAEIIHETTSPEPQIAGLDSHGHLELSQTNGLRIVVWQRPAATTITLLLHHALSDGLGLMEFLADWLGIYDQRFHQRDEALRRPDYALQPFLDRGRQRWILAEPITRWQAMRGMFVETYRWLTRRPTILRGTKNVAERISAIPQLLHETLSVEETSRLRQFADQQQVTVNDVLLRDLFVTLARWQGGGQLRKSRHWLRVNVPTNLRLLGEPALPACNVIGYAFLTHRERECTNAEKLLADLAAEMNAVRRWNLGQMFLDGLASAERMSGVVRWFLRGSRCMATSVLSNMGDMRRYFRKVLSRQGRHYYAGDAPLLKVLAAPPVRPGTHAVFLVSICGDELTITCRAHPRQVSESEQQELLAMFAASVRETIAAVPPSAMATNQDGSE